MDISNFKFWSMGLVLKDKLRGDDVVEIYPIEKIPDEDMNLSKIIIDDIEIINKINVDKDNIKDNKEKINLIKKVGILATWASVTNYNRITPPDVCRYEYVKIYRVKNSDQFYWDTYMNDIRLRKKEDVIFAFSDKDELDLNETLDNMYYLRVNTFDKMVHFHTTDTNGELTTYDISLDTLNGLLRTIDGKGNEITLDSDKNDHLTKILKSIRRETIDESVKCETHSMDASKTIDTHTKNETKNIDENLVINLNKISIKNNTTELISLLCDYINAHIVEQHIGNLGIPTDLKGDSVSKYQDILSKMTSLKI